MPQQPRSPRMLVLALLGAAATTLAMTAGCYGESRPITGGEVLPFRAALRGAAQLPALDPLATARFASASFDVVGGSAPEEMAGAAAAGLQTLQAAVDEGFAALSECTRAGEGSLTFENCSDGAGSLSGSVRREADRVTGQLDYQADELAARVSFELSAANGFLDGIISASVSGAQGTAGFDASGEITIGELTLDELLCPIAGTVNFETGGTGFGRSFSGGAAIRFGSFCGYFEGEVTGDLATPYPQSTSFFEGRGAPAVSGGSPLT